MQPLMRKLIVLLGKLIISRLTPRRTKMSEMKLMNLRLGFNQGHVLLHSSRSSNRRTHSALRSLDGGGTQCSILAAAVQSAASAPKNALTACPSPQIWDLSIWTLPTISDTDGQRFDWSDFNCFRVEGPPPQEFKLLVCEDQTRKAGLGLLPDICAQKL